MTGAELLEAVEALGISQNQAAWACDVNERTFRRWVSGVLTVPGSVVTLLAVMRKYGLSVEQVVDARERYEAGAGGMK